MSERWVVDRHNGIWFDREADDLKVSKGLAQKMRVVSREGADAYEEFAVEREHAELLRDKLNALEADLADWKAKAERYKAALEGIRDMPRGDEIAGKSRRYARAALSPGGQAEPKEPSRSVQRRIAHQKGEPVPEWYDENPYLSEPKGGE